jgi:hypothetical protein
MPSTSEQQMPLPIRVRRSTLTALANGLFGAGVLLLLVAMYRHGSFRSPLLLAAGVLLAGAIASWIAAARWGRIEEEVDQSNGSSSS